MLVWALAEGLSQNFIMWLSWWPHFGEWPFVSVSLPIPVLSLRRLSRGPKPPSSPGEARPPATTATRKPLAGIPGTLTTQARESEIYLWPACPLARVNLPDMILHSTPDSHCNYDERPPQPIRTTAEPEAGAWETTPRCGSESEGRVSQGGRMANVGFAV